MYYYFAYGSNIDEQGFLIKTYFGNKWVFCIPKETKSSHFSTNLGSIYYKGY